MDLTKLKNDAASVTSYQPPLPPFWSQVVVEVIRYSLLTGFLVLICGYVEGVGWWLPFYKI